MTQVKRSTRNVTQRLWLFLLCPFVCQFLAVACATPQLWPDEPGLPVALSRADNLQASEAFLSTLTAQRQAASLPPPIVAPRYQSEIQAIAEDLQAGKLSEPAARRGIETWGHTAFGREVTSFTIDCSRTPMQLPGELVKLPAAVVSYASAHFRPRSLPAEQCVVLVVAVRGAERVQEQRMEQRPQ